MVKKIYIEDHNQVLEDIRDSFEVVQNWQEAEAVVVWQDIRGKLVETVARANLARIPTLVMQHGLRASREYSGLQGKELLAQRIMVWGPKDKQRIVSERVEPERIIVTGTTITDHRLPKIKHEGINVLFVPLHWDKEINENFEVAKVLNGIKGINLKTKTIDGQNLEHYKNIVESHRDEKSHLDIIGKLLSETDIVVSLNESTTEFRAYCEDLPVIVVDNWRPKRFLDSWVKRIDTDFSQACIRSKLCDLQNNLFMAANNPRLKEKEMKQALIDEMGLGFDKRTPKQRIVEAIRFADNKYEQ